MMLRCGLLALFALLLTSCGPQQPLQIGFISGQTGDFADLGIGGLHGAILAVESRNAAQGVHGRQVSLLVRDDQHNINRARAVMQGLLNEDVVAVIGPMTSTIATELVPLANAQRTVLMGGTIVTRKLSGLDDYFLRAIADSSLYGANTARFQREVLGVTHAAVLYDVANSGYSEDWAKSYAEEFTRRGGQAVRLVPFNSRNTSELLAPAVAALIQKPQIVTLVASAKSAASLSKELRRHNPEVRLAAAAWAANEQLIELGESAVEGMSVEQYHDISDRSETYLRFHEAFTQRFGRAPDYAAVVAYDATSIVLDALNQTQNRTELKKVILRQGRFRGLQGDIVLDAQGDATRRAYMSEIRQRKFQPLDWHAKP